MSSISQVSSEMKTILSKRAKALERSTGFVQRATAQLDGPIFAQMTVLTWMHHPQAGYAHLRITAASLGVSVSGQAFEQRKSRVLGAPAAGVVRGGGGGGDQQ